MGAWGIEPLENDTAADLAYSLFDKLDDFWDKLDRYLYNNTFDQVRVDVDEIRAMCYIIEHLRIDITNARKKKLLVLINKALKDSSYFSTWESGDRDIVKNQLERYRTYFSK